MWVKKKKGVFCRKCGYKMAMYNCDEYFLVCRKCGHLNDSNKATRFGYNRTKWLS